jgi:hypothetical protein
MKITQALPMSDSDLHKHYFVLRVALDEIKPPIWRRVAVPASITLDLLHDVIQATMGWEDCHLHQFTIGNRRYTEAPENSEEGIDENGVLLGGLLDGAKTKIAYCYDFGDGWQHTVTVEKIEKIPEGHSLEMTCLAGKRSCPPEDCGGPSGYATYLVALADPRHEEHKSMLRWRGAFDPEAFNLDDANRELAKLARWSRRRKR